MSTDLSGLSSAKLDNWYAVFAVNDNGQAKFKLVPYFRCFGVSGNVISLAAGGENTNLTPSATSYDANINSFQGCDVLVISQGGQLIPSVRKITANTATTITLNDAAGVSQLDYLLPAPAGFDDYHYLATAYYETPGEWRNIADSGSEVRARMVTVAECPASGAATAFKIRFGGLISPLAQGATINLSETISTDSSGTVSESLWHDSSNHDIWSCAQQKVTSGNLAFSDMADLTFSGEQAAWLNTGGSLGSTVVSRSILVYGWLEI
jgi:hypothetical protein